MQDWLNPDLDPVPHAAAFARHGRVRIPGVLVPAVAERLHVCLRYETPWHLVFNDGAAVRVLDPATLSAERRARLEREATSRARDGFQFLYEAYPMVDARRGGWDPGLMLHDLLGVLNGPAMLDLVRGVTGLPGLTGADAQATRYRPGHFLTRHDDCGERAERRRVAYVLGLTPIWDPDWGGMLTFQDGDEGPGGAGPVEGGRVVESWPPVFNSLSLFRVPVPHAVGIVAPFARADRLSVTGWWRD